MRVPKSLLGDILRHAAFAFTRRNHNPVCVVEGAVYDLHIRDVCVRPFDIGRRHVTLREGTVDDSSSVAPVRCKAPSPEFVHALRCAPCLHLLLDYGGTLVAASGAPCEPDEELHALLVALTRKPDTRVTVVSSRTRGVLDRALGHYAVGIYAEHCRWYRGSAGAWIERTRCGDSWMINAYLLLEQVARERPGTFVEMKDRSVVLHHHAVQDPTKVRWLHALHGRIEPLLWGHGAIRIETTRDAFEVRPTALSKRTAVEDAVLERVPGERIVAIGDGIADEDMFWAVQGYGDSILVGDGPTRATWRLPDARALRVLLAQVAGS